MKTQQLLCKVFFVYILTGNFVVAQSKLPLNFDETLGQRPASLISREIIYTYFHGLRHNNTEAFLEGAGYEVFIQRWELKDNRSSYEKIKRKLAPQGEFMASYNSSLLPQDTRILVYAEKFLPNLILYQRFYLMNHPKGGIFIIGFTSYNSYDKSLMDYLVSSIYYDGLYDKPFLLSSLSEEYIDGKKTEVSCVSFWKNSDRLYDKQDTLSQYFLETGFGQVNWGMHESLKKAEQMRDIQLEITKQRYLIKIISEQLVEIIFEGKRVKAIQLIYNSERPGILLGWDNRVYAYYIATEINGIYYYAAMNFQEGEIPITLIAPLEVKILQLKK